ncbi:hypothetical protein [Photorhabdus australis]|uniref:hypothetical protein n=1 Tax=Photorhabdus australis TaxID=286156 RepID=UPI0030DC7C0F
MEQIIFNSVLSAVSTVLQVNSGQTAQVLSSPASHFVNTNSLSENNVLTVNLLKHWVEFSIRVLEDIL